MKEKTVEIVTVSVSTYNSSKYIIETLESIKSQTYPRLILQISDDCSTDNTIKLCNEWIENNKGRFENTKVIIPKHNTGVAGNLNRAWDACETRFIKDIAGDDKLMPNCIEDNMKYMEDHPDAVFVFSKINVFGSNENQNKKIEAQFDYSKFSWSLEKQLDFFLRGKNFVTASTCFANIEKIRELNLRNDERIPLLEDTPKWANAIKKGVKLHFFDKETVGYRVHNTSLSTSKKPSRRFQRSLEMYFFLYTYPYLYSIDPEYATTLAYNRISKLFRYKNLVQNTIFYKFFELLKSWGIIKEQKIETKE